LNRGTQKEHEYLYWEFHEGGGRLALLEGDWKMVILNAKSEEQIELYNLGDDLGETNNLADANPEMTKEMYDKLKSIRVESDIFPFYTK
jgi:arylsulfatase A-like enzyme